MKKNVIYVLEVEAFKRQYQNSNGEPPSDKIVEIYKLLVDISYETYLQGQSGVPFSLFLPTCLKRIDDK